MSLPPGFLDELRTRTSLAQVVGRKVVWDLRKSNQGRGDMWAPCPFHQEKTASFHVEDSKGFYYCFGCHANGDAISFVRETENVSFMEAVEILAAEAGLPMPAPDPAARAKDDRRSTLADVMESAVRFFRLQLSSGLGAGAADYLDRRGLSGAARDRFDMGYAPGSRRALWQHLTEQGAEPQQIVDAGLAIRPDDGGMPFDRFRNRVMFPIRDARGRCIAFGGRALDPGERAKYLNSPETELFDKGRSLYNVGPARKAAGKGGNLIVAEGYMDVIALSEAGFEASVAPLGTAITEDQLRMIWRISPEPLIALDGDKAGMRAAMRLIDLALPLIGAGQGLRIALMPENKDPDDVIRDGGPPAMQAILDAAQPVVALLWQREIQDKVFDSPERKARLDLRLAELVSQIQDPVLKEHYRREFRQLRWALFSPPRRKGGDWKQKAPAGPVAATRRSAKIDETANSVDRACETAIFRALLRVPSVYARFHDRLEHLDLKTPGFRALAQTVSMTEGMSFGAAREVIAQNSPASVLETLWSPTHVEPVLPGRMKACPDRAFQSVDESLTKLAAERGVAEEQAEAEYQIARDVEVLAPELAEVGEDWEGAEDPNSWRAAEAARIKSSAERRQQDDLADFDLGANGAPINRDERNDLDRLIGDIRFDRPRHRS